MEELEYKLNSNNPVIIAQIFSKILQNIKQKYKEDTKECPELKFLREKCLSPDPLVSEVAASALIELVADKVLRIDLTIAEFIITIPTAKCYSSLIKIIGTLLNLELKRKLHINKEYKSYNLYSPQHPYITILIENPEVWHYVFNEIRVLYTEETSHYVVELCKPVYLYALCNPVRNNLQLLKQNLLTFILNYSDAENTIFYDILCWMQVKTQTNLEMNSELLIEALNYFCAIPEELVNIEILLLWQASILYNLAVNRLDIRACVYNLRSVLSKRDNLVVVNCLLLLLTKTIEVCSPIYLFDLLNLCKDLLSYHGKDKYILEALKASLLQWLVCSSTLIMQANEVTDSIFTYIHNYKPIPTDEGVCLLLPQLSEKNILQWLDKLASSPPDLIAQLYYLLCGFFLRNDLSPKISSRAFSIILSYAERNKLVSSQLLILILNKLSNTLDPQLHSALLKALPKMVGLRENIPSVMGTLQAISQGSADLYNFSLSLMFDAWKVEPKCYTYLENMLVQYDVTEKEWETYVTKAYVLKELCERKPELYGKDVVAHLSKVLNECLNDDGSLPSALAIYGIKSLCRAEVIDVVTTWETLWPKFKNDTRVLVIKSLCSLIHEIPYLPYAECYTDLKEEVVKALWDYVNIDDLQVKGAALDSLTSFSFEEICAQLPEKYLDENVIQERQKSSSGTLQTVPGHVWIKFLSENGASKQACEFIIKMMSIEIANYLKYVYQVKGSREPINYAYLPTHSIVRGIADYVRTSTNKWKNSIHEVLYIECMRILSQEYSKPLPPLDWCFLQELLHESKLKEYCLDIACHQAVLSGTARRLIENYVAAATEDPQEHEIITIMRNLKHLANSIQPIIMKPFLEKAVKYAINSYSDDYGEKLLEKISKYLIEVLRAEIVQETNKITIAQVLRHQISVINMRSELFDIFLQCIIALPTKYLEEAISIKSDLSEEWFEKVTKIRCTVASNAKIAPLSWLDEIINVSSTMKRNLDTTNELISVFQRHSSNGEECGLWLLDLFGQIQVTVIDRCDKKEMIYFFDTLMLAVVEFSGYSLFILDPNADYHATVKKLFPQALNALMNMDHWSVCTSQALEWLYHMNTEETVPFEYRNIFGSALQTLRHDEEFMKHVRWMKYLGSRISHDTS